MNKRATPCLMSDLLRNKHPVFPQPKFKLLISEGDQRLVEKSLAKIFLVDALQANRLALTNTTRDPELMTLDNFLPFSLSLCSYYRKPQPAIITAMCLCCKWKTSMTAAYVFHHWCGLITLAIEFVNVFFAQSLIYL